MGNVNFSKLRKIAEENPGFRFGLAGSYVDDTQRPGSDIDIVIDGDSMRMDIAELVEQSFSEEVDILWVELLKADDECLDAFLESNGLPRNEYSAYKTIIKEVIWV